MSKKREVVSDTLIKTAADPSVTSDYYKPFCLGLPDWCPCCVEMDRSRKSLKLKRPRVASSKQQTSQEDEQDDAKRLKEDDERFSFDVTFENLCRFKEGECPVNTEKNTEWAFRNFESWRVARNSRYSNDQCPASVLCSATDNELCEWLCKYVSETRKADGQSTPHEAYIYCCLDYKDISES